MTKDDQRDITLLVLRGDWSADEFKELEKASSLDAPEGMQPC